MMSAEPKGRGSNSLKDRFFNDDKLRRAIRICFEFRDGNNLVYPTAIRRALELVTGENVTNFKAQNAKASVTNNSSINGKNMGVCPNPALCTHK